MRILHWRWPWASPERLTSANRDFQTALDHAHADVTASDATVRNLDAQLALQQPVIEQESLDIAAAEDNAEIRAGTADPLRRIDGDRLRHHSACAADRRRRWAKGSRSCSTENPVARGREEGRRSHHRTSQGCRQLDRARAVEQQMALNLAYTMIAAPVDGTIGARSLRVGQFVQAGTQLSNACAGEQGIIKPCWIVLSLLS